VAPYTPSRGDIVALSFDPQAGHEQAGRRPAVVISDVAFNQRTGLALVCPVTSRDRGFPLHVMLPAGLSVRGVVMTEQVRVLDYRERDASFIETAPLEVLDEVRALVHSFMY
jgi:mRNA interferase MazF